jgi:hypothetical protein
MEWGFFIVFQKYQSVKEWEKVKFPFDSIKIDSVKYSQVQRMEVVAI